MQHGHVMPKGNGFYELGIQPSLNARQHVDYEYKKN